MQRIMIMGCCGAGKSTLSKKLHQITGIELIHLDQYYWNENWVETEPKKWKNTVENLASKEAWIIDGNYGGTLDIRTKKADTIIFLDFPTIICMKRVLHRTWKYHKKTRPDMTEGCNERFDLDFLHYVATFNLRRRKKLLQKLEVLKKKKAVHILQSDRQVRAFLKCYGLKDHKFDGNENIGENNRI